MPTDADEVRAAFDDLTSGAVDGDSLLRSVTARARRQRRVQVLGAVGALGVGLAGAAGVINLLQTPDRITTIPAQSDEMVFCAGGREPITRRDYPVARQRAPFELRVPSPLPAGACLLNVEYDNWGGVAGEFFVSLQFRWDASHVVSVFHSNRAVDANPQGEPVQIGGRIWLRLESSNSAVVPESNRGPGGGIVYFTSRFDEVVIGVETRTGTESAGREVAELISRNEAEGSATPGPDSSPEAIAACTRGAEREAAKFGDVRLTGRICRQRGTSSRGTRAGTR